MFFSMLLVLSSLCVLRAELIAFDCADQNVEVSKISLLDVQPCRDPKQDSTEMTTTIQLVQERRYAEIHVFNCLITV